ncbi:hypothetical protein BDR26DRAFT_378753 [Obelidium mucronatum]|nr:hypothetical protein BDR26DRAFT_378753 [Obelidium mucronatum]
MMSAISFVYNMTLASLSLTKEEEAERKTKLPEHFIHPTTTTTTTTSATTADAPKQTVKAATTRLPGSQTHASAFIQNNNPTSAISGFASQMFSNTVKVLGDTASVLKATAETVGGTVDGFTQGLIAGFKEDPTSTGQNSAGTMSSTTTTSTSGDSKSSVADSPHAESSPIDIKGGGTGGNHPTKKAIDRNTSTSRSGTPQNASPTANSGFAQSPGAKAGTAFGKSLIASRQAALKLFTPGSSVLTAQSVFGGRPSETELGSGGGGGGAGPSVAVVRRSISRGSVNEELSSSPGHSLGNYFENRLSETEKNMLEDYEMQLALALSLSESNQANLEGGVPTGLLIDVEPERRITTPVGNANDNDSDDEIPLERKKKIVTTVE